jgi:hypothetical protein
MICLRRAAPGVTLEKLIVKSRGTGPIKKFACLAGFMCLMLTACGRKETPPVSEDARLSQIIVGTWVKIEGHSKLTNCFRADGSDSLAAYITKSNDVEAFNYEGTWLITNTNVVFTLTKSSEPKLQPVGTVARAHIIQLDAERLVYNLDGQIIAWNRLK